MATKLADVFVLGKTNLPGSLQTVVRSGDAPKPPLKPINIGEIRKSGFHQPSLFLSLHIVQLLKGNS